MAAEPTTQPAAASGTVPLGDLTVNRMGFGAMRLTGSGVWGDPPDREGAKAVLQARGRARCDADRHRGVVRARGERGADRRDAPPVSEGVVVATKGGLTRPGPGRWQPDGRPETLRESLEGSLRRLRLERIDLYQLHSVDPQVPLEESVGALRRASAAGEDPARRALERRRPAAGDGAGDRPGRLGPEPLQRRRPLLGPRARRVRAGGDRVSALVPARVGGPRLGDGPAGGDRAEPRRTPAQVALAWLLRRSSVMAPIPGTSSVEHLEEDVAAAALELTDAEFAGLSQAAEASL